MLYSVNQMQPEDKYPHATGIINSVKTELESLLKEKELEEQTYYGRIPLYRVGELELRYADGKLRIT
jgi:hypothetical protein